MTIPLIPTISITHTSLYPIYPYITNLHPSSSSLPLILRL